MWTTQMLYENFQNGTFCHFNTMPCNTSYYRQATTLFEVPHCNRGFGSPADSDIPVHISLSASGFGSPDPYLLANSNISVHIR